LKQHLRTGGVARNADGVAFTPKGGCPLKPLHAPLQ